MSSAEPAAATDPDFEALLEFLRDTHQVDFTGYKRTSLRRLVERRMRTARVDDVRSYLDRLEVDPAEVRALFDALLINVTAFRRDPGAWEALETKLVPELLAKLDDDEPIRVWSAACASGEEAYTLAMLLHRQLGDEAYRRRVKIYATDVDEPALATARAGRYPLAAVEALDPADVSTYFTFSDASVTFRADLRQNIIFGRHDLLADAPISRVSLLACRNVLMYFTAETQARILERFAFALHRHGLLFLGRAEMLLTHGDLFVPVDLGNRIFRVTRRPTGLRMPGWVARDAARDSTVRRVAEAAFTSSPDGQVVLDRDQKVVLVNDAAVRHLGLSRDDVGRTFSDLELSYRPTELRGPVADVLETGQPLEVKDVRWERRGTDETWWDVRVSLLPGTEADELAVQITFVDMTHYHQLTSELTEAHVALQEAYEELQSSSEELETTNEELQSAIEELETTNEELQSTNEELETMNEELQSTNEELQTVNDELRDRTNEVDEVNGFLESILESLQSGVVVVDRDYRVLVWNARSERMWGLRAFEVQGRHLLELAGQLPLDTLRDLVRQVLTGVADTASAEVVLGNRFGQQVLCSLSGSVLRDRAEQVRGAIVTMDEHPLEPELIAEEPAP